MSNGLERREFLKVLGVTGVWSRGNSNVAADMRIVISANALGSDEWVGIDDISITNANTPPAAAKRRPAPPMMSPVRRCGVPSGSGGPAGPARTAVTVTLANANGSAGYPEGYRWVERLASDLNDDGLGDALLSGSDAVYLFFGEALLDASETTASADLVFRPSATGVDFGAQVAFGDLNADQTADAVVAAPLDDAGGTDAGAVFVFFGPFAASPSPRYSGSASAVVRGANAGDRLGASLVVRDVTGDGLGDLVIGAPENDSSGTDAGAVYVFHDELDQARDGHRYYLVARQGRAVIGYGGLMFAASDAHVTNLAVHPDHRRAGHQRGVTTRRDLSDRHRT